MNDTHSHISSLFSYYETILSKPIEDYASKKIRLRLPQIPNNLLFELLDSVIHTLQNDEIIVELSSNVVIVGDINGQILDLLQILRHFGSPKNTQYLFLGNIIGAGDFSLETSILIYSLKVLWPDHVFILRGSNEMTTQIRSTPLYNSIESIYSDEQIAKKYLQCFSFTPIAAIIENPNPSPDPEKPAFPILCLHGGISISFEDLDSLKSISKPILRAPKLISDILYSGPTDALPVFLPSSNGYGSLFGKDALAEFLDRNHLSLLIRGHGSVEEGVKFQFDDTLINVSSCSIDYNVFNSKETNFFSITQDFSLHPFGVYYIGPECKEKVFSGLYSIKRTEVAWVNSETEDSFIVLNNRSIANLSTSTRVTINDPHRAANVKKVISTGAVLKGGPILKPTIRKPDVSKSKLTRKTLRFTI